MLPALRPGEFVLVDGSRSLAVGDLVVAVHPLEESTEVVKRLVSVDSSGRLEVASDNDAEGTDSRTWGLLDPASFRGVVTCNLSRGFDG